MTIKVCEQCGQEFRTQATWKHFCSLACFQKALRWRKTGVGLRTCNPWAEWRQWRYGRRGELNTLKAREEFRAKCKEYDWKCAYCGCELDETTVQRDHVIPLAFCGSNDISNIVPTCRDCNCSKSYKSVWQWQRDRKRKQSTQQGRLK